VPPDTLKILNNIYGQAVQALRLMGADSVQQRQRGQALIQNVVRNLGQVIQQASARSAAAPQRAEDVGELVGLAGLFDSAGAHATADILDLAASQMRSRKALEATLQQRLVAHADELDREGKHAEADAMEMAALIIGARRRAKDEAPLAPLKPGRLTPLSSRYCPDHRGVQVARIAENTYQCPVDGKTYNYEAGYVDYQGQRVPGGSVAGQTASATPYGVPHRVFDTRENILNSMN